MPAARVHVIGDRSALGSSREIRKAFPDSIVWVGLGSAPKVVKRMQEVHHDLGGDGAFDTEREGTSRLKELLADKALLLIIDDAWRREDVNAFDILGPRRRALITTRDAGLLTSLGGTHHVVELLTNAESLRLLAVAADKPLEELPAEAHQVLQQCGRLPLAVALAGGLVVAGAPWASLQKALERHKLEFLENEQSAEPQHRNLWKTIEISVEALPDEEQSRLVELAVFPEDEAVPEAAIATLWEQTGNLDDLDAQQLLIKLKRRSFIQVTASGTADSSSIVRERDAAAVGQFLSDLRHRPMSGETPMSDPDKQIPTDRPVGHGPGEFFRRVVRATMSGTSRIGAVSQTDAEQHRFRQSPEPSRAPPAHMRGRLTPRANSLDNIQMNPPKHRPCRPPMRQDRRLLASHPHPQTALVTTFLPSHTDQLLTTCRAVD